MSDIQDYEDLQSYQNNLENTIELREKLIKFEDLLYKKHEENNMLIKIHEDFKVLHEKTRRECLDLNQKLVQAYERKNLSDKKYEADIAKMKNNFEKQKEVYENQILKMTTNDSEVLKNKLTAEIELRFRNNLKEKDLEIESLNDKNFELKKKFELLSSEYETFKNEFSVETSILKENNKIEVKELIYKIQLLNEKCENNIDREPIRNIKQELDSYRRTVSELQNEISNLRRDKDILTSEKNEIKINLIKQLDEEKLKQKILQNEIEKLEYSVKINETEMKNLKIKTDEKTDEIRNLINDKLTMSKDLRLKEIEYENSKNEIKLLRQNLNERDREFEENLRIQNENDKQKYLQEKADKEEYQKKIEELTNNLRNTQHEFKEYHEKTSEELHSVKRDFYIVQEEKRNLIKKITELQEETEYFKEDYETKCRNLESYEKEYENMENQVRNLSNREIEYFKMKSALEAEINKKNEEIEQLNNLVKNNGVKSKTKIIEELSKRKKHYKKQVNIFLILVYYL